MAGVRVSPAMWGWLMILCGCCANVLSLEFITKRDKGAGHLITFAQFSFIAAEGFLQQFNFRTWSLSPRVIPWRIYALLTSLFFAASVLNNWALNFNISMPVHTVFRSSGLAGTLLTGYLFYKKRYSLHQVVSCMLVCVGICTLTLADAQVRAMQAASCCGGDPVAMANLQSQQQDAAIDTAPTAPALDSSADVGVANSTSVLSLLGPLGLGLSSQVSPLLLDAWSSLTGLGLVLDLRWAAGIAMLTSTLFMLAFLGFEQEKTYAIHGKVWREMMFYTHAISLPFCAIMLRQIVAQARAWTEASSQVAMVLPEFLPGALAGSEVRVSMFVFLAINLLTQSVCFKGVAMLTCHTSALTLSLALTFRKFLSLLLSILYFSNPFTRAHWAGSLAVFVGILAYANETTCKRVWAWMTQKDDSLEDGAKRGNEGRSAVADSGSAAIPPEVSSPTQEIGEPAHSDAASPDPMPTDSPSAGLRSRSSRASAVQARAAIANGANSGSSKKKRATPVASQSS